MWRNNESRKTEEKNIAHVFVMTGSNPNTGWLNGSVVLDNKGFIKTGPDLSPEDLAGSHWPVTRQPYLLESNVPGVYAAGDVRGDNVERVASAVSEGSNRDLVRSPNIERAAHAVLHAHDVKETLYSLPRILRVLTLAYHRVMQPRTDVPSAGYPPGPPHSLHEGAPR